MLWLCFVNNDAEGGSLAHWLVVHAISNLYLPHFFMAGTVTYLFFWRYSTILCNTRSRVPGRTSYGCCLESLVPPTISQVALSFHSTHHPHGGSLAESNSKRKDWYPPQQAQGTSIEVRTTHSGQTKTKVLITLERHMASPCLGITHIQVSTVMSWIHGDEKHGETTLVVAYLRACISPAVCSISLSQASAADHHHILCLLV